jgi:hypothetical protein
MDWANVSSFYFYFYFYFSVYFFYSYFLGGSSSFGWGSYNLKPNAYVGLTFDAGNNQI